MAQDQGMAIGDLTAGLTAQGFLPSEFRLGQLELLLADGFLEEAQPFVQELLAGLFGAIAGAGEMEHKGRIAQPRRVVDPHVVGQTVFLTQGHKETTGHADAQMTVEQA